MHSLLDDKIFSIELNSVMTKLSLPEIFAHMCAEDEVEFCYLQAHMHHAWHSFLVQVAAVSMGRSNCTQPPTCAGTWRDMLLHAAEIDGGNEYSWHIITSEGEQAFMQVPAQEVICEKNLKSDLDTVISSKGHIVKQNRIKRFTLEQLAFSLVNFITMKKYTGKTHYGIVRSNGQSRPGISYTNSLFWSQRFLRDLSNLLDPEYITEMTSIYNVDGPAFLWILPWHENSPLNSFHHNFVEVAQRVKIAKGNFIYIKGSDEKRINNKDVAGVTSDPWTPIEVKGAKCLTQKGPFSYERISELFFDSLGKYSHGVCAFQVNEDNFLTGSVLTTGTGITEGYYTFTLPIKFNKRQIKNKEKVRLGALSVVWVKQAQRVKTALRYAVLALYTLQKGAKGPPDSAMKLIASTDFDRKINDIFFKELFGRDLSKTDEELNVEFFNKIVNIAKSILEEAINKVAFKSSYKYKAIAESKRRFNNSLYKTKKSKKTK